MNVRNVPFAAVVDVDGTPRVRMGAQFVPEIRNLVTDAPEMKSALTKLVKAAAFTTVNRTRGEVGTPNEGLEIIHLTCKGVYRNGDMTADEFQALCLSLAGNLAPIQQTKANVLDIASEKSSITVQLTSAHRATIRRDPSHVIRQEVVDQLTGETAERLINEYGFSVALVPNEWRSASQLMDTVKEESVDLAF